MTRVLFSALLFAGCASTMHVKKNEPFILNKKATVYIRSGSFLVKSARVSNDSLVVGDYYSMREARMPLSSVNKLVYRSRITGALHGLWMGPLIGVAGGVASFNSCEKNPEYASGGMCGIGIIVMPILGLEMGPIVGAIVGVNRNVVFDP